MNTNIQFVNPASLSKNPAYSQAVTIQGSGKTIYIGGQNGVNKDHEVTGKGDLAKQTALALQNIETALEACGATVSNVLKLSIYIVQGQDLATGFQAAQPFLSKLSNSPIVTMLFVAGLANPDFLVEIEALAFVAQ